MLSNINEALNKNNTHIDYSNNQLANILSNSINLAKNESSPISMEGNNTARIIAKDPINRVRNQHTFSDFVKNIHQNN